ncbi:holin [Tsukamurella tyrosinosolvens]|uniref:holin n=1 Tax=Tsukamurella tyrosinosolvens TaxID=57704 RepID=UPI002DD44927|nr:holin [Tsukamurella tyrosinosolvens]MEC4615782.1 holin [Tsukamurella tyrosinosolvens]
MSNTYTDGTTATSLRDVATDVAEKAVKTFAQTLLLFLVAGTSVLNVPWSTAVQGAAIATIGTVVLALAQTAWASANPYVETLARAARTFLATLGGAIPVVDGSHAFVFTDVNWAQAAGIAGTAALISLLTSVVSLPIGPNRASPSLVR